MDASGSGRRLRRARVGSRREFLRAGGSGLFGLGLPGLPRARGLGPGAAASTSFGRAKACILLFMWGGPAQQETWDLKPDAPEAFRGEFRPIATNVPGIAISEHFPGLARQAHRLAIVRSVHHADVNHLTATHELLTGRPIPVVGGGPMADDWPHYGAVLSRLNRAGERGRTGLPPFVQMRPTVPEGAPRFVESSHGQGAGWLGPALNPFTIDDDPNRPDYRVGAFRLPEDVGSGRFEDRRRLLRTVEVQARHLERS